MRLRALWKWAKWFALGIIVLLAVWYAWTHQDLVAALGRISASYLVLLFGLGFALKLVLGVEFMVICRAFGVRLSFREWFGLSVCNTMYNLLLPGRAGAGVRALYLKRAHRLPYAHFGALFAASSVLNLVVAAVVGLAAAWAPAAEQAHGRLRVAFLLLLSFSVAGVGILAGASRVVCYVPVAGLRQVLGRVAGGLKLLWDRRGALALLGALRVVGLLFGAGLYLACCRSLDLQVRASQAVILQSLGMFSVLLPLTPGSLGVREGIMSVAGHYMGLSAQMVLLAALVQRAVIMVLTFGLGTVFSYVLLQGVSAPSEAVAAGELPGE